MLIDDVIVVMTNFLYSLPALHDVLIHFGQLSLYNVNCPQSNLIGIYLDQSTKLTLKSLIPIPVGPSLNVYIPRDTVTSNILRTNYEALHKKLQDICSSLRSTRASWYGRTALAKLFLLPHLLYLFSTLPVPLLASQLDTLQRILNKFIWEGKPPRIKQSVMYTAMSKAGMEDLNLKNY